ncbi:MAG TPA: 4Fe-4S dicluster domain-containing protein [Longimicrobiaceae bacterium]|nr:4Fe-4S dicluster domain-containing protein [Longimicrobiaceae bacterium]
MSFLRRRSAPPAPEPGAAPQTPPSRADDDGVLTIVGAGTSDLPHGPLPTDAARLRLLAGSHVEAAAGRCVQCGICSYSCPVGIDVRSYSRRAMPVLESHCILCGECVARCPRGVLSFHRPGGA